MYYISTFGGSASAWLSLVLNLHPEVVCFHGSKSLPPASPGRLPDLQPEEFFAGLRDMFNAARGMKVFGAIHGFYGLEAREAVEKEEGAFLALIRHPILRINSLFHGHASAIEDYQWKEGDPYKALCEAEWAQAEFDLSHGTAINLHPVAQRFLELCIGTVRYDMECMAGLPASDVLIQERLVADRMYFARAFSRIVGVYRDAKHLDIQIEPTDQYLDRVFSTHPHNVRSRTLKSADEVFESWPPLFKLLLALVIKGNGGLTAFKLYHAFGYRLPEPLYRVEYGRTSASLWAGLTSADAGGARHAVPDGPSPAFFRDVAAITRS